MNEQKYRRVERELFSRAGIETREHVVGLRQVGGRARVIETGAGQPVLFLTGGPNVAASFAFLAARLPGFRCLLLDRPGTGLSPKLPTPPDPERLPNYAAELVVDVLDGLELATAHLVMSSLGGYMALRTALTNPARVERIVLLGCPAFVPGWTQPEFFTLLRTPVLGQIIVRLPAGRRDALRFLRAMGSSKALDQNRIPEVLIDHIQSWMSHTDTMRNDAAMIRACGTRSSGFDARLDLRPDELRQIQVPTLVLVGTEDSVGGPDVVAGVARMLGDGSTEPIEDAGHLPWIDDPATVGKAANAFLRK